MKLVLHPVTVADFDAARQFYTSDTGDLVAAALPAFWPVDPSDTASAKTRADWSAQQQTDHFQRDPTIRFVKVVDADRSDELVAFGRWHDYPNGNEQFADYEVVGAKDRHDPATWPPGFGKEAFLDFYDSAIAARREWQAPGHCWSK